MRFSKFMHSCGSVIGALTLGAAVSALADEPLTPSAHERGVEAETPVENPSMPALSLREAVDLAIENNLNVEVERHAPFIAREDVSLAWSAYDPLFTGDFTYSNSRQPNTSSFTDSESSITKGRDGSAAVGALVPYLGASVGMAYTASRSKTNQGFTSLSPQWNSGFAITATVPLMKGLVWNQQWTQVELSNSLHSSTLEEFRAVLMDTVHDTVSAYWNLVATRERLRVAKKSHQTALALLAQTRTQFEVGVKSKVEVIESEAGVAERELDVINADANYNNAQDLLIATIYGVRLTPGSALMVQPTDKPSDFDELDVNADHATKVAIENRPEFANLEYAIKRFETIVRFQKNQRLPELNLDLSYGTSGIEGKGNPDAFVAPFGDPPSDTGGGFSDTHDDWFKQRGGRDYRVGGSITIPLGNYGPRHSVSKARLELRRAKTQLLTLHQAIILEVRRDIRLARAARKGIDASERQRIAAEEQLRAERIRLEHGESTPFDVLQKEADLVNAEVSKIQALQLYRTSVSDLDRVQGTILRTHNIVVGSVSDLRNGMAKESFSPMDILDPVLP